MGQKCKVFRQIFYGKLYTRLEKATVCEGGVFTPSPQSPPLEGGEVAITRQYITGMRPDTNEAIYNMRTATA